MAKRTDSTVKKSTQRTATKKTTTRKAVTGRKTITKSRTITMPTEEQIRARAYEIYMQRNEGPGNAYSDWVQAEQELLRDSIT